MAEERCRTGISSGIVVRKGLVRPGIGEAIRLTFNYIKQAHRKGTKKNPTKKYHLAGIVLISSFRGNKER
jgi:hypothetical protein